MLIKTLLLASISFNPPMPKTWTEPGPKYCPRIIITDLTGGDWEARDKEAVTTSKKHCRKFYKNSPCVRDITKLANYDYNTTCTQRIDK